MNARFFFFALAPLFALCAFPLTGTATTAYELELRESYVGGAYTDYGNAMGRKTGRVSEQESFFHFVATPQLNASSLLRLGVEWRRYSFGVGRGAPIPSTLQATSLLFGFDFQFGDSWLARIEATPGCFGDFHTISFKDVNCPFVIGGTYIANPDLQWVAGILVDVNDRYPVLPGAGVRWKCAEKWVLNAILPAPRVEYTYNRNLTLFAGGDFQMSAYRMNSHFGDQHSGNPELNHALLNYTEIRVGGGLSWKFGNGMSAEIETGSMVYRDFKYPYAHANYTTLGGAAYAQIALVGKF